MKFSYGIIRSLAFLTTCVLGLTVFTLRLSAQSADQLQALQYERFRDFVQTMDVVVNDDDFTFKGKAKAEFTNNTGDTLHCLYFHAHFNAFQPGSPTYNRVATIGPNRLKPEIFANLKPNEIGKLDITQGTLNGQTVTVSRTWTIIRVDGIKPIAPQEKISFEFEFAGQVPVQIRRSGRNNAQGVRYSMAQWFPKLCQYDQHGWHNNQFVLREFYGVWGKYDVHLTLPAKLVVGASGVLQNPQEIGHGYQFDRDTTVVPSQQSTPSTTKTWHFIAFPVHDFAWTADEDYVHTIVRATAPMSSANNDLTFHILYRSKYTAQWAAVGTWLKGTFSFMGKNYFPYPYKTFTCTQAGDGGMEYPNLVMLKSDYGSSFRGTVIHESIHQWFYGIAANNETKHGWMDEGLTDYMTDRVDAEEFGFPAASAPSSTLGNWLVPVRKENIERNRSFLRVCAFGYDEPLITPHDRYNEDMTAVMVYKKGSSWLRQFEYSFGKEKVDAALRLYLDRWKYRHPYPVDFERVCEDVFGQRMDEVFDTMLYGTELPDYSLRQLTSTPEGGKWRTIVDIAKGERAHVPLNLFATDYAGITQNFRIPSDIPQSSAYAPDATKPTTNSLPIWFWTDKYYRASFLADHEIQSVRLDTAGNLLRVNLPNQVIRQGFFSRVPDLKVGFWTRFDQATPLDYYGVSLRPSLWYNTLGGYQVGIRADAAADWHSPQIMLGVYYNTNAANTGTRAIGWQLGSTMFIGMGGQLVTTTVRVSDMDNVMYFGGRMTTDFRPVRYAVTEQLLASVILESWQFRDRSYFPEGYFPSAESFFRFGLTSERKWQSGSTGVDASFYGTGSNTFGFQAILQAQQNLMESPYANLKIRGFFSSLAGIVPLAARYTLQTGSAIDRFENVPARFARFLPVENSSLRALMLGGGGFVRAVPDLMRSIFAANIFFGNKTTFKALGINIPVLNALKPSAYISGALAFTEIPDNNAPLSSYAHFDSGVALSLNLSDILTDSRLLWMFPHEVSVSVFVPLISKQPFQDWLIGTDGVRIGISTAL